MNRAKKTYRNPVGVAGGLARVRARGRRGFVLFMALGVLAVVWMLALAAAGSTHSSQRIAQLQVERDQAAAIRATMQSLAGSKDGLTGEGSMELGTWSVSWEEIGLGKSEYADANPPGDEKWRVLRVACGRGGRRGANAVLYDLLFVDAGDGWQLRGWEVAGGANRT